MLPNINPKQMEKMMRQMGIKTDNIDAAEVIIKLSSGNELVISNPGVQKVSMSGQESFQITGEAIEREALPASSQAPAEPSKEDVEMVASQAGVSSDEAENALKEANGDIAEAILKLKK